MHLALVTVLIMLRCLQNDLDATKTFTELKNGLEDMGTLLKVKLMMDVASYQFPLNQRYLIHMSSFLLCH